MLAKFNLYHRTGALIGFEVNGATDFKSLGDQLDQALAGGVWSVMEPERALAGSRTYEITGWVYGRSAKQSVPLVWLYSPVSPQHKVAQVYSEKIDTLPLGVNLKTSGIKPYPGGVAPQKQNAITDGWYQECKPFTVLVEDTGDDFEGHNIYKFVRVIDAAPVEQPQPPLQQPPPVRVTTQGPPPLDDNEPDVDNPFAPDSPPMARLKSGIEKVFGNESRFATTWIVESRNRKHTPNQLRSRIEQLSNDECDIIADSLDQNPAGVLKAWNQYKSVLLAQQGAGGK